MSGKDHYAARFASHYGEASTGYLNTWAALCRLDDLIEDAEKLKGNFDAVMPEDRRIHPWVGAEVISYYAVGYVTCLEWHARSRLVDLLTFKPSAAKTEDLRAVRDKIVLEMLASNVRIATIVGAATNVSNFDDYTGMFSRVFGEFSLDVDAFEAIRSKRLDTGEQWVEDYEIEDLKNLYKFRNELVHEIGITRVGHINVRDRWGPDEAIRIGKLVRRTIQALEATISAKLPGSFPNKIGPDGYPVSEWQRIEQELPALEKRVERLLTEFSEDDIPTDENWASAKASATDYIAKEMSFIDEAAVFHNRYVEMREPIKLALMKSRYDYLKGIQKAVCSVWDVDEMQEFGPPEASDVPA